MNLYFQDPTFSESYSLHEALLEACEGASCGGGSYAFVTQDGVKLLLEDVTFDEFVSHGLFKLIVGIDQITNENALASLNNLKEKYGDKLEIFAFLHKTKGSLFHPKFSWFRRNSGGVFVVGSGNLTASGLRRNREAFSFVEVDQSEIEEIEAYWNKWLEHSASYLKPIDDSAVIEKAKSNARVSSVIRRAKVSEVEIDISEESEQQGEEISEDTEAWNFVGSDSVLIAEIPDGGTRWNQANFHKDSFTGFFGATPGDNRLRVLLRNVSNEGLLNDIEVRPSVSVKSQNYRFELGAASGLTYPSAERPIGVFVRVSTRMFLYVLAMPTNEYYSEVRQFLESQYDGPGGRMMKEITISVQELQTNCSGLPIWQI